MSDKETLLSEIRALYDYVDRDTFNIKVVEEMLSQLLVKAKGMEEPKECVGSAEAVSGYAERTNEADEAFERMFSGSFADRLSDAVNEMARKTEDSIRSRKLVRDSLLGSSDSTEEYNLKAEECKCDALTDSEFWLLKRNRSKGI